MKVSKKEIEAAKTAKGGWTKATFALWGIAWPPQKGWREALINGTPVPSRTQSSPQDLLNQVVGRIIETGNGYLLADLAELNAFYGGKVPTVRDFVGNAEFYEITGGLELIDVVYRFSCVRRRPAMEKGE